MELYVQGGELRGQIIGRAAHMDSPRIAIDSSLGHSLVIRMMYTGRGMFEYRIYMLLIYSIYSINRVIMRPCMFVTL